MLGQHRNRAIRKIDTVAAAQGFAVQGGIVGYVVGHIRNGDPQVDAAVVRLLDTDRVVEVAGTRRVDCHEQALSQVDPEPEFCGIELGRMGPGLGKCCGWEVDGQTVSPDQRLKIRLGLSRSTEPLDDAPPGGGGSLVDDRAPPSLGFAGLASFDGLEQHDLALFGLADVLALDAHEPLARIAIGCHEGGAAPLMEDAEPVVAPAGENLNHLAATSLVRQQQDTVSPARATGVRHGPHLTAFALDAPPGFPVSGRCEDPLDQAVAATDAIAAAHALDASRILEGCEQALDAALCAVAQPELTQQSRGGHRRAPRQDSHHAVGRQCPRRSPRRALATAARLRASSFPTPPLGPSPTVYTVRETRADAAPYTSRARSGTIAL